MRSSSSLALGFFIYITAFGLAFFTLASDNFAGNSQKSSKVKVTPPLDARWTLDSVETVSVSHGDITFKAVATFRVNVYRPVEILEISFATEGDAELLGQYDKVWENTLVGFTCSESVSLNLPRNRRGVVIGNVLAKTRTGGTLFGRRSDLYLIANESGLIHGTSSFIELDIRRLKKEREMGVITEKEFQRRLKELIGGGAKEESETNSVLKQ